MDKMYTVSDAAKHLKVSTKTILREIKRENLKAEKVGRRILISEKNLRQYLNKDTTDSRKRLNSLIRGKRGQMVDLLQKMVSLPSIGYKQSGEFELANFIYQKLQDFGIRSVLLKEGDAVAIRASFGYADKGFLINSPLDTAPVGNIENWKYPPFAGIIKAGKMYGRGTADCKAGIVSAIYSLLFLKEVVAEDDIRIELVFDGGEQDGTYTGMQMVLDRGLYADSAIIGYAGDEFDLAIGCRGYHRYTFKTLGKSAHTGARYNSGVNAIKTMIDFIQQMYSHPLPKSQAKYFPFGQKITFSTIEGGRAINVVPDECTARLDFRLTPDFSKEFVDELIRKTVEQQKRKDKDFLMKWDYDVGNEGYIVSEKAKVVTSVSEAVSKIYKKKPKIVASGPAHVGNILYRQKIPSVVWGPRGANVHSYDEYVEVGSLVDTVDVYVNAVLNYFDID